MIDLKKLRESFFSERKAINELADHKNQDKKRRKKAQKQEEKD